MKAIAKVRDSICESGEFCHAVAQVTLMGFGVSVIALNIAQLT